MAGETQTSNVSGEMTQRFIEFVMMQAQNAALFLGQIPNPQTGKGEVNLELAKMFIDQLGMIQEKTRGNLSQEEANVLRNALSNLQMVFVEISQAVKSGEIKPEAPAPAAEQAAEAAPESAPAEPEQSTPPGEDPDSKKRFTKSYG